MVASCAPADRRGDRRLAPPRLRAHLSPPHGQHCSNSSNAVSPAATSLERELGQGGMAVVFLAQDLRHDRKVALKVLRPDLSAAIGAERFLREIKLAAGLTHPHILPVYDSGEADGLLFYVMPNMEGPLAAGAARAGAAAAAGRRAGHHPRGRVRAGLRPPAPGGPPRHQAGEHPAPRRLGDGGRLRHRQGAERRRLAHPDGHGRRHADLHEPRAGLRRADRGRPERPLQPGLRALRDADRRAAVHRRHAAGHHRQAVRLPDSEGAGHPRRARGGGRRADPRAGPDPGGPVRHRRRSSSRRCVRSNGAGGSAQATVATGRTPPARPRARPSRSSRSPT